MLVSICATKYTSSDAHTSTHSLTRTYLQVVEGMSSVEEEGFTCRSAIAIEGPVETWMSACEEEMHSSLQVRLLSHISDSE